MSFRLKLRKLFPTCPLKLARDIQLAHLRTLQEALELDLERKAVGAAVTGNLSGTGLVARTMVL